MSAPVAITGIGVVSSLGVTRERYRDGLLNGCTAIRPDSALQAAGCRSVLAARLCGFEPSHWISPMKLRRMDDTGPIALVAAQQAIADAAYAVSETGDDRAGVAFGTYSAGGRATNDYLDALFRGGPTGAPALLFNSTVGNAATGLTALELKLRGPNLTVSQKEASGLAAIVTAVDLLRDGRADAFLAGGVDAIYDIFFKAHDRFAVMNDSPAFGNSAAPFSRFRRGFVMGEGGFILWLEGRSARPGSGAHHYGEILGVGAASAAVPLNAWPDRVEPLVRTMRLALDDAHIRPPDIDVVYASANASLQLDDVESRALMEVFPERPPIVTSVKGAIGECGASGSASLVAALLCGATHRVPPIAGLREGDSIVGPLPLATSAVPLPGPVALINSFASGGALFSVVIKTGC